MTQPVETPPIKCTSRSCTWRGYETGRLQPLANAANQRTACPYCGCREVQAMTAQQIKIYRKQQAAHNNAPQLVTN
ncbi:hypothetical protein [uncultured Deefgea sp.]|uniref:hypothetical protein n=1 Tax=uncultured Deefgea sp. TaxID=1304914 RepID=UPI002602592E|nr:hypothetical protein [uncultured Deefgea sp.]